MKLCMSWRNEVTTLIRMAQGAFRSARKGLPLSCLQCTQAQVQPSLHLIPSCFSFLQPGAYYKPEEYTYGSYDWIKLQ